MPAAQDARAGAGMAVASMVLIQLGLAASVDLIERVGAEGAAWLRLFWAGALMLAFVRPRFSRFSRTALRTGAALGGVSAGMTMMFMAAVERLPLGTASALEFLGPLSIAVCRSRGLGRAWSLVAAVGIVLITQPWTEHVDPVGVGFALVAAVFWAAYIVLTQRVGDEVAGVAGLSISMPAAALTATVVAGPEVWQRMTPELMMVGLGLAVLLPVVPFMLELLALRRLNMAAFSTLMCLEPAFALVIGLLALHQVPDAAAAAGIGCVVAAGIGAENSGGRPLANSP